MRKVFKRSVAALGVVVLLLVAARAALPVYLTRYVNRTLDRIPGYSGRVDEVDVALWRGAYSIKGARLSKTGGKVPVPLFSCPDIRLSVDWRALWNGALVGRIETVSPRLDFVTAPREADAQLAVDSSWQDAVRDLFPLRIDRFDVADGSVHFRDFHSDPKVDVSVDRINARATNLTNSLDVSRSLTATLEAEGRMERKAPLKVSVSWDPYAKSPSFDFNGSLSSLPLAALNDFLKAYAGFDAERGTVSLYSELAARGGRFTGYYKPLLDDVHVVSLSKDRDYWLQPLWEGVVAFATEVFQDQSKDRVAARIPVSGSFDRPELGIFAAVGSVVANAFLERLPPGLEKSVSPGSFGRKDGG